MTHSLNKTIASEWFIKVFDEKYGKRLAEVTEYSSEFEDMVDFVTEYFEKEHGIEIDSFDANKILTGNDKFIPESVERPYKTMVKISGPFPKVNLLRGYPRENTFTPIADLLNSGCPPSSIDLAYASLVTYKEYI